MTVAIIIPALNEAETITDVVASVLESGRVIVVDDGSRDCTADVAARAGAIVVSNETNLGYDGALQRGFEKAAEIGSEIAITIDADGQHDGDAVSGMLAPLLNGDADLVLGIRPKTARFSEWLFNLFARLRFGVPDILCGMKAYRMSLYYAHGRFDGSQSIGTELALAGLRCGLRCACIPVPIHHRDGTPRFGSVLRANWKILRALTGAILRDVRAHRKHEHERAEI